MKKRLPRVAAALACAAAGAAAAALASAAQLASPPSLAQAPDAAKPPPGSAADHSASNASGARKPAYTKKFDLSALPDYKPQVQVSGKLRVWGANYIADSGLADRWKEDFNKYQPNVEFDFNLPSAAIAIPALFFDLADVVMDHEPTFYDYLAHLRVKGYNPTGVQIVTGSLDVGGWNNTITAAVVAEGRGKLD